MDAILTMLQTQWVFILISLIIIGGVFAVKKIKPNIFKNFCIGALVGTIVLLIVCSVIFKLPDLFLLLPVAIICCELFGYGVTGKVLGVLLVDYLFIIFLNNLYQNNVISDLVNSILFIVSQFATAIVAGLFMDKHLRKLQKAKKEKLSAKVQAEKEQESNLENQIQNIMETATQPNQGESQLSENTEDDISLNATSNTEYSIDLSKYGLDEEDMK